ncbi:hypothetical protein BWU74_32300 [Paraburkholderia caledonica]|nr:hypothetical protein BWU74_32300 [Burkholderia sp. Bk]
MGRTPPVVNVSIGFAGAEEDLLGDTRAPMIARLNIHITQAKICCVGGKQQSGLPPGTMEETAECPNAVGAFAAMAIDSPACRGSPRRPVAAEDVRNLQHEMLQGMGLSRR